MQIIKIHKWKHGVLLFHAINTFIDNPNPCTLWTYLQRFNSFASCYYREWWQCEECPYSNGQDGLPLCSYKIVRDTKWSDEIISQYLIATIEIRSALKILLGDVNEEKETS